jgi:hypothetical protein
MVSFFNTFISYLLLVVIMVALAICGGFVGKKLRDNKNAKEALKAETDKQE